METRAQSPADVVVLDARPVAGQLEVEVTLPCPRTHVRVRFPAGEVGRADARLPDGRTWAAKHHWSEGDGVVVYAFDEALPERGVRLLVPFAPLAG